MNIMTGSSMDIQQFETDLARLDTADDFSVHYIVRDNLYKLWVMIRIPLSANCRNYLIDTTHLTMYENDEKISDHKVLILCT